VLSLVWSILDGLTQITILSLISINVPGVANDFNMVLLALAQLDILPAEMIENYFFNFDDHKDPPINNYFDMVGYENKNSLRNLGSASIYFLASFAILIYIFLMDSIIKCFEIQPTSTK